MMMTTMIVMTVSIIPAMMMITMITVMMILTVMVVIGRGRLKTAGTTRSGGTAGLCWVITAAAAARPCCMI